MSSSKLRKHFEQEQHSGNAVVENFCLIGTPLPPLDAKRDANEFKPAWQQEVYDEQGRRRFHGAFTGGWSAGYFNTVGSKEGWKPSSFRSSRKDSKVNGSSSQNVQSVEDFMDEEDKADLLQGRGALQYNDPSIARHSHPDPLLGALGGDSLPRQDTQSSTNFLPSEMGARILEQMGWKPGQGIGALVSVAILRQRQALLGLSIEGMSGRSEAEQVPPPDTPLPQAIPQRSTRRGLGWTENSDSRRDDFEAKEEFGRRDASTRSGAGFGIGALEHDSDGEDEVYASGNRMPRLQTKTGTGSASKKAVGQVTSGTNSLAGGVTGNGNRWHDGLPMIAGFVVASRDQGMDEWHDAPLIPQGWQPKPSRVWVDSSIGSTGSKDGGELNAHSRASILGEARAPGPPPAISDYLSAKDRERLERAKTQNEIGPSTASADKRDGQKINDPEIPRLERGVAQAALRGFMPFGDDKGKQARYRAYLDSQIDPSDLDPPLHGSAISIEHRRQELNEFFQSAAIFKPMNVVMANRFETARAPIAKEERPAGLHMPERKAEGAIGVEDANLDFLPSLTPAQQFARLGLFGPRTTRAVKEWIPSRLLCKRFNVQPPHVDDEASATQIGTEEEPSLDARAASRPATKSDLNARWEESKRQLQRLVAERALDNGARTENEISVPTSDNPENSSDLSNVGFGDVVSGEDESTTHDDKPSLEVFKAIFEEEEGMSPREAAATQDPPRMAFVPRKRPNEIAPQKGEPIEGLTTKRAKRKEKKSKGMLTFNLDEEDS